MARPFRWAIDWLGVVIHCAGQGLVFTGAGLVMVATMMISDDFRQ
jgi:hypothetical protein